MKTETLIAIQDIGYALKHGRFVTSKPTVLGIIHEGAKTNELKMTPHEFLLYSLKAIKEDNDITNIHFEMSFKNRKEAEELGEVLLAL